MRVGLSTDILLEGEGEIITDKFPAGNYAELVYTGDYKDMMHAHMALEAWAKEQGLKEPMSTTPDGCTWGGRTEFYLNDCMEIPNPADWETKVSFLLKE